MHVVKDFAIYPIYLMVYEEADRAGRAWPENDGGSLRWQIWTFSAWNTPKEFIRAELS